ncbi:hypothetical protein CspeluHIS016_0112710 [Cutaneotrichosporon spelunceum]|uniref:Uncharacterized protein n=1 Tax=Cutaneotrichosporon spelunceum TaxID=1672016 RepID=A0AAD3TQT4_9TREE|nr:hypothetical protein CspeluHIS016_0112710 [Cutaneotrichosporon spelunceum]
MGSNPPITAVPFSLAQPKVHIARYLDSVRPYVGEHANRGTAYFVRSRRGGDHLCEEDWNPDYLPPADSSFSDHALALSAFLQALSSPGASTSQLCDLSAKGSVLADSLRPRLRDNTKLVDHERGKHHPFTRGASALRISPYPMRSGIKTGDVPSGSDHFAGLCLNQQPHQPQTQRYGPDLGLHNRAFLPDPLATPLAPLGVEYEIAHNLGVSPRKVNAGPSGVPGASPKRVTAPDVSRSPMSQDVVNAAPGRHTIARPGIFARGVTSQPIKVTAIPQQPSTGVAPYQMDERLLLGLMSNRAQEQAPHPLPSIQLAPQSHTTLGNMRMGSSFTPWPLSRPCQTQQQTPPGTSSLPLEDPSLLVDAMLPFYASRSRNGTQYQQLPTPPSALASLLPTELSNLVSPIDTAPSPLDVFEAMHSNAPQASEQRAVSADPPRWDSSPEAFDWARPVSAPPSKLAQPPLNEATHARMPTPSFTQAEFQDLLTGSSDPARNGGGALAPLQQSAKPPVDFAYTLRPNDYDFGLKWPGCADASNWDMSPQTYHPAPYTYGYSPPAQAELTTSVLPTSGPSGSSSFPSWHDTYSPQDSPGDAPLPQACATHAYI